MAKERHIGTVKLWKSDAGYGFLMRPGAPDLFVHVSNLSGANSLEPGQEVSYANGKDSRRRDCALSVTRIGCRQVGSPTRTSEPKRPMACDMTDEAG